MPRGAGLRPGAKAPDEPPEPYRRRARSRPYRRAGGRKCTYGNRPVARLRKRRISHRPLPATRLSSTLLKVAAWEGRRLQAGPQVEQPAGGGHGREREGWAATAPPVGRGRCRSRKELDTARDGWAIRRRAGRARARCAATPRRRHEHPNASSYTGTRARPGLAGPQSSRAGRSIWCSRVTGIHSRARQVTRRAWRCGASHWDKVEELPAYLALSNWRYRTDATSIHRSLGRR